MARSQLEVLRIHNKGKQVVSLQVKPPGGDFFLHEQQVHVYPGKSVMLPKDHVRIEQINNLAARGILRITFNSENQ